MTRRRLLGLMIGLAVSQGRRAHAQTYTPQAAAGLSVTFSTEKMGGSRVLVFGDVRNTTDNPAERVVILVEGLDENGQPVSRVRTFVHGNVPSRGTASFEARLLASGRERRYRASIESFQFVVGN
jgi:hypothetical protein